jgi:hypothetical protein
MARRLAPLLLAALVLAGACSGGLLNRPATPGTVHARVVTGGGESRLLLVPVYVGDRGPYDFALDTGAARTVVDSRLASQLRLPSTGSEQAVTGVTGTSEAQRVRVTSWRVDAVPLPDSTILSLRLASGSGPSLAGLLGSDMLGRFRTVTIDYQSGTVTLR